MKTRKATRFLSLLLMLCMVLSLLPSSAFAEKQPEPMHELPEQALQEQQPEFLYSDASVSFDQSDALMAETLEEKTIVLRRGGNVSAALELTLLVYDNNANYGEDYQLRYRGELISKLDGATSVYDAFRDGGVLTEGLLFDMSTTYQAQVAEENGEAAENISAAQMLSQLDELGALAARIPVTFAPGEASIVLTVQLLDDDLKEYEESFLLAVLDGQGEAIENAQLLLAIEDNEEAPTVTVGFDCAYTLVADSKTGLAQLSFRRVGDLATTTLATLLMNGEALGYVDFAPHQDRQTVWVVPGTYTLAPGDDHSITGETVKVLSTDGSVTVPEGADPELDAIPNAYASMGSKATKAWSIPGWFPDWARHTSTVETYDYIYYMGSTSNAIFKAGNSSGVGRWNMFNGGGNEHCIETDGTGSRIKKGWRNVHSVKQDYDMTGIESIEITACMTDLDYDNQVIIGFDKVTGSGRTEVGRTTKNNSGDNTVTVEYFLPENCQDKGMVFVENKDPTKSDDGCNMYIPNGFKATKRTYRFVISNPEDLYFRGIGDVDISIQDASSSIYMKMGSDSNVTIAYQVENDLPVKLTGYQIRNMSTGTTSDVIPISGSSFTFNQSFLKSYESKYCANTKDGSNTYETFEIIPKFEKIPLTVELEDAILGSIAIRDYTSGTQLYVGERIVVEGKPVAGATFYGVYFKNYKNISSGTFTSGTIDTSSTAATIDLGKFDKIILQGAFRTTEDRLMVNYAEADPSKRHGTLGFPEGVVIKPEEYIKGDYFPLTAEPEKGYVTRWQSDGRYYYGNTFYYQLDKNSNHNWITVEFLPESSLSMKTGTVSGTLYVYDVELRSCMETKMRLIGNKYSVFSDKEYTGISDASGKYTLENFTAVEGGTYSVMVIYRDMVGYATFVPFGNSSTPEDRDVEMAQFASGSIYPSEVSISLGTVTSSQNVVQVRTTDTGDITVQVTNEAGNKGSVTKVELVFLSTRASDYGNELTRITLDYNEQLTAENDSTLYSYWTYTVTDPGVLPVQSRMFVSVTADKVYASADENGNVSTATGSITSGLVNSGYEFIQAITDTTIPVEQSVPDLPGAQDANLSAEDRGALEIPLIGNADFSLTSTSGGYFVQRVVNGTTYLICGYSLTPIYGVGTLSSKYDGAVKTQAAIKAQSEANAKAMAGSADMESVLLGNGNYNAPAQQPAKKQSSDWSFQPAFMLKLALTPGVDANGNDKVYVTGFELALGFDAFYRKNIPFSVYGVPFYICFAVSIEALAQGQFYYKPGTTESGSDLTLSLYEMCQEPGAMDNAVSSGENFIAAPILSLGLKAGVGYNCFLGVYVDGTVSMPMIFQFNPSFDAAGEIGFKLSVGADLVFFSANYNAINPTKPFGDSALHEELLAVQGYAAADPSKHAITANEKNTHILEAGDETPTLEEMLGNLSFSLMERPENGTNLLRSGTVDSATLAKNVFKNTNVQLVRLESGKIMALFLEDNGEDSLNYLSAAYAISEDDGLTWSDISFVNSNIGQANTSLQFDINVFELQDRILITWSEADFEDLLKDVDVNKLTVAQIAGVMNAMNLRGRFFDPVTGEAMSEAFTIAEHSTVACGALDAVQNGEDVYVYYQRNVFPTEDDVTVTDLMSTERTIALARVDVKDPSAWESTPVRVESENGQQYRITEVEPFVHDGVMGEVLVIDRNGMLAVYNEEGGSWTADNEDRQLYLRTYDFAEDGTPQPTALLPLTDAEDCAQSPLVVSNENHLHLFWNENGEVLYLTDFVATHEDHKDVQASAVVLKNKDGNITVVEQESISGHQITGSETMHIGTAFTASMADDGNVLLAWVGEDLEDQNLISAEEIYGVILNTVTNAEALVRGGKDGGNENVYQLWPVGAPIALTDEDSLIGDLDSLCMESGKDSKFLLAFTKLNATLRTEVTSADLMAVQSVDAPKVVLEEISAPTYPLPGAEMPVQATVTNYGLEPLKGAKFTASGIGEEVSLEYAGTVLPGESVAVELMVAVPAGFNQDTELKVTVCGLGEQADYADSGTTGICYGPYFALEEMSDLISIPNSTDCQAITRVKNIGNAAGQPTLTFTNTIYGSGEQHKEYVFESDVTVAPGEEVILTHVLEDTLMNKARNANLVVSTGDNYDQRMDSLMPVPVMEDREDETAEPDIPIEEIFTDVESHWAKEDIEFVYYEGLMNGMSASTFAPDSTTTRAMLVTVLWRMAGSPLVDCILPFTDVESGQWYTEAIRWAQCTGIVTGYGGGLFGPNDPVTREQMAAIFYRYAKHMGHRTTVEVDLSTFKDHQLISEYAKHPLGWACAVGLINGVTTDTLCPRDNATRAQMATILRRFCELP